MLHYRNTLYISIYFIQLGRQLRIIKFLGTSQILNVRLIISTAIFSLSPPPPLSHSSPSLSFSIHSPSPDLSFERRFEPSIHRFSFQLAFATNIAFAFETQTKTMEVGSGAKGVVALKREASSQLRRSESTYGFQLVRIVMLKGSAEKLALG